MTVKTSKSSYRKFLSASVSVSALLFVATGVPAFAEDGEQAVPAAPVVSTAAQSATNAASPVVETNRYFMRLMTQIFDGSKEFSHTQMAAFARKRQGNISWTMMDFGDGAVVITQPDTLSVGGFKNTSKAELGVLYNYDTKTIEGSSAVANFHNTYVRPQLDRAPALGSNIGWSTQIPLSAFGVPGVSGQQVKLELSREYFTHDGKEMVLLQYKVPALRFDSGSGTTVVHWGRGFALSDPGFGNIYASAALHRSVADEGDSEQRPYRYYRSGFASNDDGKMMLDIKKIPAVAKIYDDYFGDTALEVIPYDDDTGAADQRPVTLAANIDVMALSIAENGANDGGTIPNAQVNGNRGNESEISNALSTAISISNGLETGTGLADKANAITNGVQALAKAGENLKSLAETTAVKYNRARETLLRDGVMKTGFTSTVQRLSDSFDNAAEANAIARAKLDGYRDYYKWMESQGVVPDAQMKASLNALEDTVISATLKQQEAFQDFSRAASKPGAVISVLDEAHPTTARLMQNLERAAGDLNAVEKQVEAFGIRATALQKLSNSIPTEKLGEILESFGNSPAGKILDGISHGMNVYTVAKVGINSYNAATSDTSSGKLQLTRDYGSGGAMVSLGLDILALGGNALSGNVPGFFSDATAITLGSITDVVIAAKGVADVEALIAETERNGLLLQIKLTKKIQAQEKAKYEDLMASDQYLPYSSDDPYADGYDTSDPRFDPDTGLPDSAYWTYLKENDPQKLANMGIDPNAPVGGWPPGTRSAEEDTGLSREELIAGLDREGRDGDYPTAPPRETYVKDKEDPAEANLGKTSELTPQQLQEIQTAQRQSAAQAKLDAEQAERTKDLPPIDNFKTPEERKAYYQKQLDAAQAERESGLPPVDNFKTPAERQAYYQQKLDESQAARSEGLPPIDNFKTPAERQAYYQKQLDAAQAEREAGLPPTDNFQTPAERQAHYQKKLDDAQAERTSGLPPIDNFKTPEERRNANQEILDNQQAERTKDLPKIDNFKTPEERKGAFQKLLDETLVQRLADRNKESDRERGAPLKISELKTSDLKISSFDIEPVVFTPVDFEKVTFDKDNDLFDEDGNLLKVGPPDFDMTDFDAPEISGIDFTNFDDDDYPGGNHIPAFTYENMSGTVATDLGPWEEWLMTQDIRKLEKLARQAGYPNLASALNDAKNLIKQADDDGYRKWALTQPPCSPSGCGPNYQGLWTMKRSTLALGDILRADRAFFSSAGLSDISIAGLRLMFSIIDFGIDDGDRVNIAVSQFGRSLLNESLTINTSGTAFDIAVQRGVVSVNMTALNTGEFPPNTAALNIQGVSGGDSNQDFSLQEGDTAGLRVTVGGN